MIITFFYKIERYVHIGKMILRCLALARAMHLGKLRRDGMKDIGKV